MDVQSILTLVNSGGVVALLLVQVVLFFRGDVISRRVLDDIVAATVTRMLAELERQRQDGKPNKQTQI